MEIEMKYEIPDKSCADQIWEDEYLKEIGDDTSREALHMKAAYFDTDDHVLLDRDIAFRVRLEGNRAVAALKWNGTSEDGLHTREEINVPVVNEDCLTNPSPTVFCESAEGKDMIALVGDKPLRKLLDIHFLRRKVRVDTGKSICEVAIDTGEITTKYGNLPICELEIELFSGSEEDVLAIGDVLAEKYGLVPENRSKYARGLALIRQGKDENEK